jgi:hypothetical protein
VSAVIITFSTSGILGISYIGVSNTSSYKTKNGMMGIHISELAILPPTKRGMMGISYIRVGNTSSYKTKRGIMGISYIRVGNTFSCLFINFSYFRLLQNHTGTGPIVTIYGTNNPWKERIQLCSNEGEYT